MRAGKRMEEKLQTILQNYIEKIELLCERLLEEINFTEHLDLKTKYDFFLYRATCRKMEFQVNGVKYRLHGIGCTAYNDDFFIDWDFGYRSRWYGIDPWKVALTLKMSKDINTEFYDGDLVKSRCDLLVEKDILFQHKNQYYFKIQKQEVFVPQFPENYDTLIIEWSGQRWEIPRKKEIDKFIRKSIWVYDKIDEDKNKCMLRFLLQGKELYQIPYSDTAYPESAVKIMSDVVLRNLIQKNCVLGD